MSKASARVWLFLPIWALGCGAADDSPGADPGAPAAMAGAGAPSNVSGAGAPSNVSGAGAPSNVSGASAGGASSMGGPAKAGAPSGGANTASGGANTASGGANTAGNNSGTAGKTGGGAGAGSAGAASTGTFGPAASCKAWPAATGSTQKVSKTQAVSKDFDGKLQRFVSDGLGDGNQGEEQQPLFELADGATLENVIIGAPAADGIHCSGTCTLKNVWWEDVGEDAATQKGKTNSSQVMTIDCGGAKAASDKVFQMNGPGTMKISNFYVSDFGKLFRSCGNCSTQFAKHVVISNILATGGKDLAGVNENYNDTATFSGILAASNITVCQRYKGNDTGAEPTATGTGPDGKVCIYKTSDIKAP
ncbi:MAG: pectate lyase [Polyangiaceae bacterium]